MGIYNILLLKTKIEEESSEKAHLFFILGFFSYFFFYHFIYSQKINELPVGTEFTSCLLLSNNFLFHFHDIIQLH